MNRHGHYGCQKGSVHSTNEQSTGSMDEHFQHMLFAETNISSVGTRDEVFATLNMKLESKPGNHTLKLNVDTGVQGNTQSPRINRRMHPTFLKAAGFPRTRGWIRS